MDRGIKDEGFVRKGLELAESKDGRWISNQDFFNGDGSEQISKKALAGVIVAANIYVERGILDEKAAIDAEKISTIQDARDFNDKYHPIVLEALEKLKDKK